MVGCWWRTLHRLPECDRYRAEIEQTGAGRLVSLPYGLQAPSSMGKQQGHERGIGLPVVASVKAPASFPELSSCRFLSHSQVSREPLVSPVPDLDLSRAESDCCWNSSGTLAPPSWPIDLDVLQVWYSWELQTIHPINLRYRTSMSSHVLFTSSFSLHDEQAMVTALQRVTPLFKHTLAHNNFPFETWFWKHRHY